MMLFAPFETEGYSPKVAGGTFNFYKKLFWTSLRINITHYVCEEAGIPTLRDIMSELAKPGRDPRKDFESVEFSPSVHGIEDLNPGMELTGVVSNVTAFGVFVDVGVHQDGLVHVSQMSDRFVKNPLDLVKAGQKVRVSVLDVDLKRRRISLAMKGVRQGPS
jgi:uncharacterized protein